MNPVSFVGPVLAFVAILALIPIALWLLKRTPLGAGAQGGLMRVVSTLPLAPNQKLLTVEVGNGDERHWLVLGVSPAGIHTLHTMAPGSAAVAPAAPAFAPLLSQWMKRSPADSTPGQIGGGDAR